MKTLICYNEIETDIRFKIVDGDFSRWNGININSMNEHEYIDEFCDWMWESETGKEKNNWLDN